MKGFQYKLWSSEIKEHHAPVKKNKMDWICDCMYWSRKISMVDVKEAIWKHYIASFHFNLTKSIHLRTDAKRERQFAVQSGFLFLLSSDESTPGRRPPTPPAGPGPLLPTRTLPLGSSRPQLCFLGPLFNLLEENEGRKSFQISSHCLGGGGSHSNAPLPLSW